MKGKDILKIWWSTFVAYIAVMFCVAHQWQNPLVSIGLTILAGGLFGNQGVIAILKTYKNGQQDGIVVIERGNK